MNCALVNRLYLLCSFVSRPTSLHCCVAVEMSSNSSTDEPSWSATSNLTTLLSSTTTVTTTTITATTLKPDEVDPPSELRFVFVPFTVIVLILLLTAMIFTFIRKKRVDRLRHHLMPMYNFAPGEEEGDWEAELLEDSAEHHRGYKSMEYPRSESTQLFAHSK